MKGDFSRVRYAPYDNFNGILPQQGKVLLDSDGIAQTLIANNWRETAARDWVGPVAGVPAAAPDSFNVSAATLAGGKVTLTVGTGRLWADGLLVRLESETGNTVTRTATWLEPPVVAMEGSASDVAAGVTDAVVLEVWQHAVNGFQMPEALIEPALGGPDTAERLQTSCAFRLARLGAGESCADLVFDESGRGKLTVSLVPPITTTGDCPVDGSGGYSGFEHQLYRIEVADVASGGSQFKWSRTNGGLVGRGTFDPATQSIAITANLAAITSANQTAFYLEIESYDQDLGFSRVIAGAQATLSGSTLQCTPAANFGAYPSASGTVFFRLWDGIAPVASYPISASPVQLENGILLQFDADATGKYFPGDYWLFPVRAQGIANPQTLIDAKTPEGIRYHRVPLAEITWASGANGSFTGGPIEDCRAVVQPLTQVRGCCTCRVGDGVESFGEFTSIQAAIDSLPPEGGEVCILPGRYYQRARILNRRDIVIHGCGWQTRVLSPSLRPKNAKTHFIYKEETGENDAANPFRAVITIVGSAHIELRSFAVEAAASEAGILLDGTGTSLSSQGNAVLTRAAVEMRGVVDTTIEDMVLTASTLPAILAERVRLLAIEKNRIAMKNVRSLWPAVYASGQEIHIERNWIGIETAGNVREWLPATVSGDLSDAESAASGEVSSSAPATAEHITIGAATAVAEHPGGIQIGGPSTDVYILENEIEGGERNGITLGSFAYVDANGNETGQWVGVSADGEGDDCCTGTLQPPGSGTNGGGKIVAGGLLVNIQIHRNRIRDMGLCGIGPAGFFNLAETLEIISIEGIHISCNAISRTMLRQAAPAKDLLANIIGYAAICLPDVQNAVIEDNAITDFGFEPGAAVCGIYILHGEMVLISRNQVLETRDWAHISEEEGDGARGGIVVMLVTPSVLNQDALNQQAINQQAINQNSAKENASGQDATAEAWSSPGAAAGQAVNALAAPIYEPGLPALRVEHNVVRVPLSYSLLALGAGPFSIVNNHFGSGGRVLAAKRPIAQTVLILNLGTAIETASVAAMPSGIFSNSQGSYPGFGAAGAQNIAAGSSGAVVFTNNVCQLEAEASRQREEGSIFIVTPDHLIFANNYCWLDGRAERAFTDALLIAGSLNVVANRFQEAPGAVNISALTAGAINITSQNISTYCIFVLGIMRIDNNNLALVQANNTELCAGLYKEFLAELGS